MIMDKLDFLKLESCAAEMAVIVGAFREGLIKHFSVVDANATRLINKRWDEDGAV